MCRMLNALSREAILKNVYCQLVNRERYQACLAKQPHKDFLDLTVRYKAVVEEHESCMLSFILDNALCTKYEISLEELDAAARENTEKRGFRRWQIRDILAELAQEPEEVKKIESLQDTCMWIFANKKIVDGAAVMLFPDTFRGLAQELGEDLFILPSSICEVIAVPVGWRSAEGLREIVLDMNSRLEAAYGSECEALSGNVYRYSLEKGMVIFV